MAELPRQVSTNQTSPDGTTPETLLFPKHGIAVSYLRKFLARISNDISRLKGLTTTQICEKYVKPLTANKEVTWKASPSNVHIHILSCFIP